MTAAMLDWIEHFRTVTSGMKVAHVWRGHGSALFLEIGELTHSTSLRRDGSPRAPAGEIGVMIEWGWRIEEGQSIICGSDSDESLWQPAFSRLVGREITGLSTFGRLPELLLSVAGDLHVASFMAAEGDPAWTLFDRRSGCDRLSLSCKAGIANLER